MAFLIAFSIGIDYKILATIFRKPALRAQANVLICVLVVIETILALLSFLEASIFLVKQEFWLNQQTCRITAAFSVCLITSHQYIYTIASFEKFIYIMFPFTYDNWFTKGKLLCFIRIPSFGLLVFIVYISVINRVYFMTYLLSCLIETDNIWITQYLSLTSFAAIF